MHEQLITETLGHLRLGEPLRNGPLCVVPVRSDTGVAARYVLLGQAIHRGTLTITEINQSGEVPYLAAFNKGPWPVLVFDGEELVGAKQNRIANVTMLLAMGKTVMPVSCVEQGRWHARSRAFRAGSYTSHPGLRRDKERQVREQAAAEDRRRAAWQHAADAAAGGATGAAGVAGAAAGAGPAGATPEEDAQHLRARRYMSYQGEVWNEVHRASTAMGAMSPTMAMSDTYHSSKSHLDRIIAAIEPGMEAVAGDAVGMMVFLGGEFVCLDVLQPAKRFARLVHKLLRGYALEALLQRDAEPAEFDAEAAALRVFAEMGRARVDDQAAAGLGHDLRLETERISGSGLVWQDQLVQLSVFPKGDQR